MSGRRNNMYDATIRRMVRESIAAKTEEFENAHRDDSDKELLEYLTAQAQRLGHPPHEREILGWELIASRFGSWTSALEQAGLPMPFTQDKLSQFALWTEEEIIQKENYTRRKAERKRLAAIKEAEREKKKKQAVRYKKSTKQNSTEEPQ